MYRRIRLGKGGAQRAECIEQGYVGLNYGLREDLTGKFPPRWRDFNAVFVPQLVENDPSLSKIAAGQPDRYFEIARPDAGGGFWAACPAASFAQPASGLFVALACTEKARLGGFAHPAPFFGQITA